MKKYIPKLSVKDICILGLLTAITALLSIFCTLRVGTIIKIPFKFVSVFVTGALFGPFLSGAVAAIGDILNCTLAPVGPIILRLTLLEFLSGFFYGLFFFRQIPTRRKYILLSCFCVFIQFLIDMFLTTAVLLSVGYFPGFWFAFITRLPAGIIKSALQLIFILASYSLLDKFRGYRHSEARR